MMLGGMLASLGMVAGSFCRTLGQLYLTAGFITGDYHSISRVTGWVLGTRLNRARCGEQGGQSSESSGAAHSHSRQRNNEQISNEGQS